MAADGDGLRTLRLPEHVVAGIESRIKGSGFRDADSFVAFVLERLLDSPAREPFSAEDEQRLREKLRSLGYID